jgi:hypothetical protein
MDVEGKSIIPAREDVKKIAGKELAMRGLMVLGRPK